MQTVLDIIQYIVDLGSYVFVPILMCIIGLIFGLKPSKAIKAGGNGGNRTHRSQYCINPNGRFPVTGHQ